MSPWTLLYADDNYYLLAYDAAEKKSDKKFKYFRVDKMEQVELLEEDRQGAEEYARIDMKTRTKSTFNMFGGEIVNVTLRFPNFRIGLALDRFGHEITPRKDGDSHFTITAPVAVGPQFYARTRHEGVMKHQKTLEMINSEYRFGSDVVPKNLKNPGISTLFKRALNNFVVLFDLFLGKHDSKHIFTK